MVRGQQVQLGPLFVGLQALDVFNSVGHHHVLVYLLPFQMFCKLFLVSGKFCKYFWFLASVYICGTSVQTPARRDLTTSGCVT